MGEHISIDENTSSLTRLRYARARIKTLCFEEMEGDEQYCCCFKERKKINFSEDESPIFGISEEWGSSNASIDNFEEEYEWLGGGFPFRGEMPEMAIENLFSLV